MRPTRGWWVTPGKRSRVGHTQGDVCTVKARGVRWTMDTLMGGWPGGGGGGGEGGKERRRQTVTMHSGTSEAL